MPMHEAQNLSGQLVAPQNPIAYWDTDVDGVARDLAVWENVLHVAIGSGNSGALTLPDVSLAKGQMYTIFLIDDGDSKEITFVIPGVTPVISPAGAIGTTLPALTANSDISVLFSDGYYWHHLVDVST